MKIFFLNLSTVDEDMNEVYGLTLDGSTVTHAHA